MRRITLAGTALLSIALGGAAGVTGAVFSSQTANGGNTFQAAASFCATQTVVTDADSYVHGDFKSSNFGTEINVWVRAGAEKSRTLVHFTLPSTPSGCTLASATLKLYAGSVTSTDGSVRTLQAYRIASAWGETAVTWNNQPATTGSASTTTAAEGWRSWDVTAQVLAMYSGTPGDTSFLVMDSSESGGIHRHISRFDSREYVLTYGGTTHPQLVLTLVAA